MAMPAHVRERLKAKLDGIPPGKLKVDKILETLDEFDEDALAQRLESKVGDATARELIASGQAASTQSLGPRTTIIFGGTNTAQNVLNSIRQAANGDNLLPDWLVNLNGLLTGDSADLASYDVMRQQIGANSNEDCQALLAELNSAVLAMSSSTAAVQQLANKTLGN